MRAFSLLDSLSIESSAVMHAPISQMPMHCGSAAHATWSPEPYATSSGAQKSTRRNSQYGPTEAARRRPDAPPSSL